MRRNRTGSALGNGSKVLTAGTYESLDPVGHTKDMGMPVIVGASSGGHFSQIDPAEALCKKGLAGED